MLSLLPTSETGARAAQVALLVGIGLILSAVLRPSSTAQRAALFAGAIVLAARYAWWRATSTLAPAGLTLDCLASWSFFAIECAAILGTVSSFVIMSRTRSRSAEVDAARLWWGGRPPRIAVLIATYNENREILERTLVGARALRYPNREIVLCDDGDRDWLPALCEEMGARYLRRAAHGGAKAGNLNAAVAVLSAEADPPQFYAVLDADFVPHRGFLSRCLALFRTADVGLVQTPQHFFNADPIQQNLGIDRSYPDEQRLFFDHLQPSRDAWGIAFCCGTSSMVRAEALEAIGGFPTDSITEDFLLTLTLQDAGWRTVYLNEALTEGLAPEGLKEYVSQRARWCLGLMQIARGRMGPLSANRLRLRDRWSVIDSLLYWTTTFLFRLAAVTYPLLYWFFDITVVNASVPEVIGYFGTHYVWVLLTLNLLSPGTVVPILNDVGQLLGAIPITRAAFAGLLNPRGHPFTVTAKGGDRNAVVVQWRLARPFIVLFLLTLTGLLIGIVWDRFAFDEAGDGKVVVLFWTIYNLVVLFVTMVVCIELPRTERHVTQQPQRVRWRTDAGLSGRAWLPELNQTSLRLRGDLQGAGPGWIDLPGVGEVRAVPHSRDFDGVCFTLQPSHAQDQALIVTLYAEDGRAPGVQRARVRRLIGQLASRFSGEPGS